MPTEDKPLQAHEHRRVLIVDDSPSFRDATLRVLREAGLDLLDVANDGPTALERVQQTRYDLMLLDWHMPEMSGLQVLTAMRHDPAQQSLPIIMLTSEDDKLNVLKAIKAGVNSYVFKDNLFTDLVPRVAKLFERTAAGTDRP